MRSLQIAFTVALLTLTAIPVKAQSSSESFSFPELGGVSLMTAGTSPSLTVAYGTINPTAGAPAAFALYGLRANGALVSEVTVPAAVSFTGGRIYAETGGGINTGLAIANTQNQSISFASYYTDSNGVQTTGAVFTIAANSQIASFLTQSPFNVPANFLGTFTFFALTPTPDLAVASIALRGFTNERGEFLMTTLPVVPIDEQILYNSSTIPHFVSGGGWSTQILLVNPTDADLAGTIRFAGQSGQPATVNAGGTESNLFNYTIPARSSARLQTSAQGVLISGSVTLSPSAQNEELPVSLVVYSYQAAGITTTMAGEPPLMPASASRTFIERSGNFGGGGILSIESGIAVSNAGAASDAQVTFQLAGLDGVPYGNQGAVDIPAGGQTSLLLNQIPGFETVPASFQGVLRISSSTPVTTMNLRLRYNERGEVLATAVPVINEGDDYYNLVLSHSNFVFPHIVDGGGYSTQFVLFSGWLPGPASGNIQFFNQDGSPFPITLQAP